MGTWNFSQYLQIIQLVGKLTSSWQWDEIVGRIWMKKLSFLNSLDPSVSVLLGYLEEIFSVPDLSVVLKSYFIQYERWYRNAMSSEQFWSRFCMLRDSPDSQGDRKTASNYCCSHTDTEIKSELGRCHLSDIWLHNKKIKCILKIYNL